MNPGATYAPPASSTRSPSGESPSPISAMRKMIWVKGRFMPCAEKGPGW